MIRRGWEQSNYSSIRLGASMCLGVGLGFWRPRVCPEWIFFQGICLLLAVLAGILGSKKNHNIAYRARYLPGILCWWSLTAGLASSQNSPVSAITSWTSSHNTSDHLGSDLLIVQVLRQVGPTRFLGLIHRRVVRTTPDPQWIAFPTHLEILLSLPYSEQPKASGTKGFIQIGDHLITDAFHLRKIMGPQHPGQADLRDYYQSQGLYFEVNLRRGGSCRVLNGNKIQQMNLRWADQSFKVKFGRWQHYWTARMDQNITDSVGKALCKALLLGWRVDLSQELQEGFRNSGTVHLLAVSGMHVLIIHQIMQWIMRLMYLSWVKFNIRRDLGHNPPKLLIFIVLSLFILTYALLTGAAPSAMRAAIVLIWMNWTGLIDGTRHATLALLNTGILLIILEPYSWKDPGFQLSFVAVGGLLWIYNPLWKLSRLDQSPLPLQYPVSLMGMSLVAQAVTAPLCWFHFGQFPNYFLVANLVLVPLSTPLLIIAMLWTLTGSASLVGPIIAWIGENLYGIVANCTSVIGKWPGAVSYHWDFQGRDLALCYGIIIILLMGIKQMTAQAKPLRRRNTIRQYVMFLGFAWVLVMAQRNLRWILEDKIPQCVVFGLSTGHCILVRGGQGLLWSGDALGLADRRPLHWARSQSKVPDLPSKNANKGMNCRILQWNNSVTFIAGACDTFALQPKPYRPLIMLQAFGHGAVRITQPVDILVLGPGTRAEWPEYHPPTHLILTGGHTKAYRRSTASRCLRQGIVLEDLSPSNLPDLSVISPQPQVK